MGVPLLRHPRPGLCRALRGVRQVVLQLLRQRLRKSHHPAPRALKEQPGVCASRSLVPLQLCCDGRVTLATGPHRHPSVEPRERSDAVIQQPFAWPNLAGAFAAN